MQLITLVTQIFRIANFYTRGSQRIPVEIPVGQEDEGGVEEVAQVVFVQATRRVEKEEEFSPTMGFPSGFLMGVSVICVRRRRHDATSCGQVRVRTDQV